MIAQENWERRLRRALNKDGYGLHKSRAKLIHADDLGGYMIVDLATNSVVAGSRFNLDLEDVEDFLKQ